MLTLTTNHKVSDVVYVVTNCVRRGVIKAVNFVEQDDSDEPFTLSYEILYDGYSFNTTINSEVTYNTTGAGSPAVGSPPSSGSPLIGSPAIFGVSIIETTTGGGIYTSKAVALTAFGDTLA